jgi:hypothetical protein
MDHTEVARGRLVACLRSALPIKDVLAASPRTQMIGSRFEKRGSITRDERKAGWV